MKLSLSQMRMVAGGALIFCAVGMTVCRLLEARYPWLAWPRAFFEAWTIGALADWFAVVALFRRPMGLPIPHTAILPNNKDRVGAALAEFVVGSFLTEERLRPRLCGFDYAGKAAGWLEEHAGLLADKAAGYLPGILEGISDVDMSKLLAKRAREMISKTKLGPMAAQGLEVLTQDGRDRELFASALKATRELIHENEAVIEGKIREEIPISGEMLGQLGMLGDLAAPMLNKLRDLIAAMVARKTIEKIEKALDEAEQDPQGKLWKSFEGRLRRLIEELKTSEELAGKIRRMQEAVASSGVVDDFAKRAWEETRDFLLRDCASESSLVRRKIDEAVRTAARRLGENAEARRELNEFI
ncbi:MAG: DUF445 domain-containing protein, partial [Terrimicrobiaceae bacterium]|nr:DUF445 domain-containing protein [Terrimicrobiaceae bacterium]